MRSIIPSLAIAVFFFANRGQIASSQESVVSQQAKSFSSGSLAYVGKDNTTLRDGPGRSFSIRINEKATRLLGETTFLTVDTSVVLRILATHKDWTKVQVIEPSSLSASHVGWLPTRLLFANKQKSEAELKLDNQLNCCGRDDGTRPLLRPIEFMEKLRHVGLTETNVEWKKANFDPGWIAIVLKRWPNSNDRLTPRQQLSAKANPIGPNEVNCQVIGPNEEVVSECIVEAELRRENDVRDTVLLATKVIKAIDDSVSDEILQSFVNQIPMNFGRWNIRKHSYANGEVSVYADYDCSIPVTTGTPNITKD